MTRYEKLLSEDLEDPEIRKEMEKLEPEFAIVRAIIDARVSSGITQEEREIILAGCLINYYAK